MLATSLRPLALAGLVCLSSACTEYRVNNQDVVLTFDAESDELTLVSDARGLYPGTSIGDTRKDRNRIAADKLIEIAEGARYLLVFDWPLVLNLEGVEDPDSPDANLAPDAELDARTSAVVESIREVYKLACEIRFESAELRADGDDHVALSQRVVFPRVTELLDAIDRTLDALVILDLGLGEDSELAQGLDPETAQLWLLHATSGEDWIELDRGTLVLRVPFSGCDIARFLRSTPKEAAKNDSDSWQFLDALLGPLAEVRFGPDGLCELRFEPSAEGGIRWSFDRGEAQDGRKLRGLLADRLEVSDSEGGR